MSGLPELYIHCPNQGLTVNITVDGKCIGMEGVAYIEGVELAAVELGRVAIVWNDDYYSFPSELVYCIAEA